MERDLTQRSLLSLHDLFEAIDIREKGIEQVYNFLLLNKTIADPKSIVTKDLGLKRIYKIFSVLKELGLVKIIDRPMKITINPPVPAWEMIISTKIKALQEELNDKINACEKSFLRVLDMFHLKDETPPIPPVEYISTTIEDDPVEFLNTLYSSNQELMVAKGLVVSNPHVQQMQNMFVSKKELTRLGYDNLDAYLQQFPKTFSHGRSKVLISEEYVENILHIMDVKTLSAEIKQKISAVINFEIDIRVHSQSFSNFIIKDHKELLQYSVDPSNALLGLFVSRQDEITQIFKNTFEKMYQNSTDFHAYFKAKYKRNPSKIDIFGCVFL